MSGFSLIIEYLTGYAVATDPASRETAEWPPHPARVFMALAAAHFETGGPPEQKRAEYDALTWLATLAPPEMAIPQHTVREAQTVYVPVNDQTGNEAHLRRSRQPRLFPRVHIGSAPLVLTWKLTGETPANHLDALESIGRQVSRIGHSSSLVWVRLEREPHAEPTHVPDEHSMEHRLRVAYPGALKRLEEDFNQTAIEEFAKLEAQADLAKGKVRKQVLESLHTRFPMGQPTTQRPVFSITQGYRKVESAPSHGTSSLFDPNFIVLRESDDSAATFGLESTSAVIRALRGLIMSKCPQPVPSWVAGHEPDGARLTSGLHMALIPLAFVGHEYADGHLMGLGIVIPREVPYRERARVFSKVLFKEGSTDPATLKLVMGRAGEWKVEREMGIASRHSLQTTTYTQSAHRWASVTPILLDRMPKFDRVKDPSGWRDEVAGIIARSCQQAGMPEPIGVRVEKTPFFRGSLRAMPGQSGFAQLRKDKFQVHAAIDFSQPVEGPVLLGAGRFLGYGLMRPWTDREGQ